MRMSHCEREHRAEGTNIWVIEGMTCGGGMLTFTLTSRPKLETTTHLSLVWFDVTTIDHGIGLWEDLPLIHKIHFSKVVDPKRIYRRLRTTQNLQKQLRKIRVASADRERGEIQNPQNSMKVASL
jgi:hypothetical protein